MSNATYNKIWTLEHQHLSDQLNYESPKDPAVVPKDRDAAFQHLAVLYIRYIQIFRKLEDTYDQILHPQKRRLLKEVLVSVMSRLIEVKQKIVELECSDVHNFNDILLDMKLIPDDLRIPVPRFIVEEISKEIAEREKMLADFGARDLNFGDAQEIFPEMSLEEAVKIIQLNERGRQGKLRAKYMADIRLQAQREREMDSAADEKEVGEAAKNIQRVYRGHVARKTVRKMRTEELIFLGMDLPVKDAKADPVKKAETNRVRRKVLQQQYEEDYQQALVSIKEKIMKIEGPDMKESIQDSFRQWYMEHKRIFGKFPEFPEDEVWQKAGFAFVPPVEGQPLPSEEAPKAEEKKPDADASKDKKKGDKKGKGDDAEQQENQFKFDDSTFLKTIETENSNYSSQWLSKDESDNFAQKHDQEIIKKNKRAEVEGEIKNEVFEILKDELKNLKLAVEKDKSKGKGKAGKKGGKGKGKKDKGKKGKKEKDLTANRTMESLVEELVKAGIFQKYPIVPIQNFKGDFDLMGSSTQKLPVIMPSLGEMQRIITELCVLPFGLKQESLESMKIPSSFLLFGARGSGKTMLVNSIATMIGAQIFNLTPRNTADQFVGKANVSKMVHMAFKVAKAHAPAIIYIDNIEMVFAKKVPKDDLSDPKRIKKDLLKNLKGLSASDRVIFIGTSYKPWEGDVKALVPIFDKLIYNPKPDYASRLMLWKEFVGKKVAHHLTSTINFSVLTRMSEGLTAGSIRLVCERVLTDRRLKVLTRMNRKLDTTEFINQLITLPPEDKEEDALFRDFYEKTPLLKKRSNLLDTPAEEGEKDKKKKK